MNSFNYYLTISQSQNPFPAIYMTSESQNCDYQGLYIAAHNYKIISLRKVVY